MSPRNLLIPPRSFSIWGWLVLGILSAPKAFPTTTQAFALLPQHSRHRHHSQRHTLRHQRASSFSDNNEPIVAAQQPTEFLATCIPGLAPYLEEELISLGAASTTVLSNAAVSFTSETIPEKSEYPIELTSLLWVRTAHRILEKIDVFYDISSRDDVYDAVKHSRLHVKDLLGDGEGGLLSLSVKVIANGRLPKDISHSHYTALTIKNALVDQVRELKEGDRPDVDLDDPDVPLVAIIHSQGPTADMTLYRSLSPPGSLHKRGYRAGGAIHKAAMKESLAAGLLLQAGFADACRNVRDTFDKDDDDDDDDDNSQTKKGLTLVDPMCGSGSLLLEAAMIAVDFAPGLMRIMCDVPGHKLPPILRWKGNKEELLATWKELLLDASERAKTGFKWMKQHQGAIELIGNDIHGGALELAEDSLTKAAGLNRVVELQQNDCSEWAVFRDNEKRLGNEIWVCTNPPWNLRLSDADHESWESLRIFLRSNCPPGTKAWVLSGNKSATKHLGLRRSQSIALKTGQQDLRWIQYIILDKKPRMEEDKRDSDNNMPRTMEDKRDSDNVSRRSEQKQPPHTTPKSKLTVDESGRRIRTRSINTMKPSSTTRSPLPRRVPAVNKEEDEDDDSWS